MSAPESPPAGGAIQIGILTEGKPTLAMVLVSLVLQEDRPVDIHIVDTADDAVIKRDDVVFAMRLAFDRGIHCGYEHIRERNRAFSVGRLRLLEEMSGPLIAFMDDDIVLAPSALATLHAWTRDRDVFGFASPICRNWGDARGAGKARRYYSPGGLIYQDATVRRLLTDYYTNNSDVLDARASGERLWEKAFLSELFPALSRECEILEEAVSYHLDYRERPLRWGLDEGVIEASEAKARALAATAT
ncbi:MAG: glycosyltransferase family A protein [Chloroflexota bacterium]